MADTATKKKPYHVEVADKLIEQLRTGTAPWERQWDTIYDPRPVNPVTGKHYKAGNYLRLMLQGCDDPRWMTFNQASEKGYKVKKGEKGTTIQYWKRQEEVPVLDENGNQIMDAEGRPQKEKIDLVRPKVFHSVVFNASQMENVPPLEKRVMTWEPVERAERVLSGSGVSISHDGLTNAYYSPGSDSIHLPPTEAFHSSEGYYATALHELAHATGHKTRLGREMSSPFGSEGYAREELIAEIGSMMMGQEIGLQPRLENNAAYVESWITLLTNHPMEILRAAEQAERAKEYVMSRELEIENSLEGEIGDVDLVAANKFAQEKAQALDSGVEASVSDSELAQMREKETQRERTLARRSAGMNTADGRIYLNVLKAEKDEAKALGAKWDGAAVAWYVPSGVDIEQFGKWERLSVEKKKVTYLSVPKAEKDEAKALGAKWDGVAGSWYAPDGSDVKALTERWPQREENRRHIFVRHAEKDEAKALGARWDPSHGKQGSWYIPEGVDQSKFQKWLDREKEFKAEKAAEAAKDTVLLAVPYAEKDEAKALGARWDKESTAWIVKKDNPNLDTLLERWAPQAQASKTLTEPSISPQEEMAEKMRSMGLVVDGEHPIFDGQPHRISVEGDKQGSHSGYYVAHADGRPAGFIQNHKTGERTNWKATGQHLSEEQKSEMKQVAQEKFAEREKQAQENRVKAQEAIAKQMKSLKEPTVPTAYMETKGIALHKGAYVNDKNTLHVPAYDVHGVIQTMQYINENGSKRFAKHGSKAGNFHAIGGQETLKGCAAIVITEGYATGATVRENTYSNAATVVAFDCGNLKPVAEALRKEYPDTPIIIAGDDDRRKRDNPGRTKAEEAAKVVGGVAVFPEFPSGVSIDGKTPSDFNDLSQLSDGKTQVHLTVQSAINNEIERMQDRSAQDQVRKELKAQIQERGFGAMERSGHLIVM